MHNQNTVANPVRVLVTFAARYGSTKEVAQAISNRLQECGFAVDLRDAREIHGLEGYSAVVLGAPFYFGAWHKDAQRFVGRFEHSLADLPVAIFALGPLVSGEQEMQDARVQLDEELEKYAWLKLVAVEMFGGKYDPAKLSITHLLLTALPASPLYGLPITDLRDWDAIRDWATTLASDPLLKLVCGLLPETGADLASQPALSRLENAVDDRTCYRLARVVLALYLAERERDGVPPTSCWIWTAPVIRSMASRKARPTTAIGVNHWFLWTKIPPFGLA